MAPVNPSPSSVFNPEASMAKVRIEFGEHGGVNQSIEVSTTFTVMDPATMPKLFSGALGAGEGCFLYGRSFNPSVMYLGKMLAGLEGTEGGYCCASGMAAVSGVILGLCNAGDHIVCSRAVYGGTHALMTDFLVQKCNITTTFVDVSDLASVRAAIRPTTRLIYCEALSNPTLRVANIPALSTIAREHNIKLVVDNTFTPVLISPARFGADIVIHSLTKFISGSSDIIAGAILGQQKFINSLFDLHNGPLMLLGPTMDPKVASELEMRLPHLAVRMREHSRRALACAQLLESLGAKVLYPGLSSHPDHALFNTLANDGYGYGGLLTVDMETLEKANALMNILQHRFQFGLIAVSLGFHETLMSASGASTSSELTDVEKREAGINPGLVRMSIGLSGELDTRLAQLKEAYERVMWHHAEEEEEGLTHTSYVPPVVEDGPAPQKAGVKGNVKVTKAMMDDVRDTVSM